MPYIINEGDSMRFKNVYFFIFCIAIGVYLGNFMLSQYKKTDDTASADKKIQTVYFFEQGVYSSKEEMEKNTSSISYYIYNEQNGKYYVYIGMTAKEANKEKLNNYFKGLGYAVTIKTYDIYNEAFLEILMQYDLMLEQTEGDTIGAIESQVLGKYEELVIRD